MKILKTAILLACFGAIPCLAVDQSVGPFGGLNTNTAPEAIGATQSSDLLNVDVSPGGVSVKKRQGYGLDVTLNISTSPAHNLYKFFDSGGNEIRLAFNDFKVNSSVNGAAWTVILTTGVTLGSTWDCTDYLGFAYCVSSAFDCPIKTNGTSAGTTGVCGTNLVPAGTLISNSGDRLLIGATSANPSRLYYSASTLFTDFSLGIQSSNSSFEDIVAPGSKLTHLAYRFGRWLWWKDQSFGFIVGTGQFDLQIVTVSNTIGTLDNTDVFDGTLCYFRGSDAQIYTYDGSSLRRTISTDIAPTLRTANRRKANSSVVTSQADWQSGASSPTFTLSTTISPGDVVTSSFTVTENSSASGWSSGTVSGLSVGTNSISLTLNNTNILNPGFETTFTNWTDSSGGVASVVTTVSGNNCTISPRSGSNYWLDGAGGAGSGGEVDSVYLQNCAGTSSSTVTTITNATNSCTWTARTLSSAGQAGKLNRILVTIGNGIFNTNALTSDCFINSGTDITFYSATDFKSAPPVSHAYIALDDFTNGRNTNTTGTFTSQAFNMGMPWAYVYPTATWTINTSTPSFVLQKSANGSTGWLDVTSSSGTNNAINASYVRYLSTITVSATTDNALAALTGVTILARSSGTYFSGWYNAPNITSWNTLTATYANGDGGNNFFVRSSTSPQYVLNSTVAWVAQTAGNTVAASTGTYFQLIDSFTITSATGTPPSLSDFTFNWYEGVAADRMYGTYFNNAIWFSLSLGTSTSTNNRIFRYDLLANLWTLYDVSANGFLTYNNNLYFGSPTTGKVFQFGNNVYSDNGTAITAYWKSKPFFGDSPFTEKELRTASWYVESDSGTTLNLTYELNRTTNTITKNINLYDSRRGVIQNNWYFPTGTAATVFSAKFGDASSNPPWEVFGGLISFVPKPWIVSP